MDEAETRAEHIDPALKTAGWGVVEGSKILREHRNTKLAVIEGKAWNEELTEGVGQAKDYAAKLTFRFTYSTNGRGIYAIDMETAKEGDIPPIRRPPNSGR